MRSRLVLTSLIYRLNLLQKYVSEQKQELAPSYNDFLTRFCEIAERKKNKAESNTIIEPFQIAPDVTWEQNENSGIVKQAFFYLDESSSVNSLKERTQVLPNTTMKVLCKQLKLDGVHAYSIDFNNWRQRYATKEDELEFYDYIMANQDY